MAIEILAKHVREYGHSNAGVDIHCLMLLAEQAMERGRGRVKWIVRGGKNTNFKVAQGEMEP